MISKTEKIFFVIIFLLVVAGMIVAHFDLKFYEAVYVREDGVIEWLTVLALISSSFLCFFRAYRLRSKRGILFITITILFGIIFLFGVGEEISWGQRLFGIDTPEFFARHNSQQETNLHNLVLNGVKINKLIFGLFLSIAIVSYFLILPVLYQKFEKISRIVNRFAIPLPRVFHVVCYLILAGLVWLTPSPKKGELLEFGGCCIFFFMIFNPKNRKLFTG